MTLGEFARRYRRERSGFPAQLQIGSIPHEEMGLDWILEDSDFKALLDYPIHAFTNRRYGKTTIVIKGAAS